MRTFRFRQRVKEIPGRLSIVWDEFARGTSPRDALSGWNRRGVIVDCREVIFDKKAKTWRVISENLAKN